MTIQHQHLKRQSSTGNRNFGVIPDLIRDPVVRAHWIAAQGRNDKQAP